MPNDAFRAARMRLMSPSRAGQPMLRREVADAVRGWLLVRTGKVFTGIDENYIGKLDRGFIRWPGWQYREALRAVLGVGSDVELGFYAVRGDDATRWAVGGRLSAECDVSAPVPPSTPTPAQVAASARRPVVGSLVTLTVTDDNAAVLAVLMAMAAPGHAVARAAVPVPRHGRAGAVAGIGRWRVRRMKVLIGSADIRRRAAVPVVVTAEQVTVAREHAGKTLAMWRRAAGITQEVLAQWSAYSRSTVANVERGRQNAPSGFWERCDTALDAQGRVLVAAEHADRLARLRRRQVVADAQRRRDRGWRGGVDPRRGGAWRIPVGTGWPP